MQITSTNQIDRDRHLPDIYWEEGVGLCVWVGVGVGRSSPCRVVVGLGRPQPGMCVWVCVCVCPGVCSAGAVMAKWCDAM